MKHENDTIEGKSVVVSGFGNVAWGICKKLAELGAKAVTCLVRTDTSTIRKVL